MHDLVIRGGLLVDGSGAPARTADVAVDSGRIAEVGKVGPGRREIAVDGLLVTPGFVDLHTHFDAQVSWDPYLTPSSAHGVTTAVMGNCGVGFAPAAPDKHDWLIGLMEGVEDIPGAAMTEGIEWGWESFPEYLDAIAKKPHAIDFAAQVPHGPLRAYVMGERGAANEDATEDDIKAMYQIVRQGLEVGALGFSTSRTLLHKSIDGVPVPGTFASAAELFGIGHALRDAKAGVFQMAGEHVLMVKEFPWIRALAEEIRRPVMFNLSQTDFAPALWRQVLGLLDEATGAGVPLLAQVAGRAIGVMMGWELTAHPFGGLPTWTNELATLPIPERVARLRDPAVRARMLTEKSADLGNFGNFVTTAFDKMFILGPSIDYEPDPADSVGAIARRTGRTPREVAYDAMLENDGRAMLYFPLFNYSDGNLEMLRQLHTHPHTRMGLSDAGAHCGAVCDGGMPTFMLTHWARDRKRGERLPLEHVIHRQTRQTAETFGLLDRGLIAPGLKADLNVIDFDRLRFHNPEVVYDLPAGGRRLMQHADGYVATIVGGEVILEHGEYTGALPGKLIRGHQS